MVQKVPKAVASCIANLPIDELEEDPERAMAKSAAPERARRSMRRGTAAAKPLQGRLVALPETREMSKLAAMLEEKGASTLHCPLIAMCDAPDLAPVESWLHQLVRREIDDVILLTGEGLTRLLGFARRAGLYDAVVSAFANVRTITRGPKPARVLREIGLLPSMPAETPTTEGVIEILREQDLRGRVVGVQLYGQKPNIKLHQFLSRAGATVRTVAPYMYTKASDDPHVAELILRLATGAIDAIAFTCSAQIHRLFEVAFSQHLEPQLASGLQQTRIAAVGPVAAASLRRRGFRVDIVPGKSFYMRSLVNEMIAVITGSHVAQRS